MMDKNSDQVAELIQKWLVGKTVGLSSASISIAAQHSLLRAGMLHAD